MLTIGKVGLTRGCLEYYDAQVAAGVEDYYAGRGESPGRWRGSGIIALGLSQGERVERRGFLALMRGLSPVDGAVLRPMGTRSTVAGLDLTFSAPKSVSVLFAVAEEGTSSALLDAHERAVAAALGYLERESCFTRRGRDGAERVRGDGYVAASYRHRMSRAGDPQLHTHVVVANLTRADGRHTALDAHSIYEHKSAAGALYRAVLRAEVRERLLWVSWRPAGRGLFEVDRIPAGVLRHFSQRRVEIEERAIELAGPAAGGLSRERMQGIALVTRRAKTYRVTGATWREQARARAAEHGLGEAELASVQHHRAEEADQPLLAELALRLSGPEGLTAAHNTFARRHALAEIAGMFPDGATASQLEAATSCYLNDRTVYPLGRGRRSELRYTTEGLLACEREILDGAERRRLDQTGVLPGESVEGAIGQYVPALNEDQAAAVRAITSSGRGVETIEALAGTGKTTMIGALADCYRQAGWHVIGVAPTARAARQLREVARIDASTMHALLSRVEHNDGFAPRMVLILDEAGMASTRRTAQLFAYAERAGVKVIAVGDPGQLRSVEAGGWLGALTRRQPGPVLREVMRQRDPQERAALEALHGGDPDRYLAHKQAAITVHGTEADALSQVAEAWNAAQLQHNRQSAVMIARDNHTRERLNRAVRDQLRRDGILPLEGVTVGGRDYVPGDRVIARRNDRQNDVDNGTLATVLDVDRNTGRMIIRTDRGQARTLDAAYVAAHLEHAYALTGHGAQGGTFAWTAVIGRPEEFTREWSYTALSRAQEHTAIHLISEPPEDQLEREQYAPAQPDRDTAQTLRVLRRAMKRSDIERLALEHVHAPNQAGARPNAAPAQHANERRNTGGDRGDRSPEQPPARVVVGRSDPADPPRLEQKREQRRSQAASRRHPEPDGLELLRRGQRGLGRTLGR